MSITQFNEGQILGRYELLLCVAQGGMARVWAARLHGSRGFRKLVAIKTILPGVLDSERLERMLLEEATLAAGIHHPNVAATFELGEQDGYPYLVMEWVDGESLQYIVRRTADGNGIPLSVAVDIVAQICQGLHAAHEHADDSGKPLGLVHRDVSPHNVLITYSGTVKLVDFGVAKATQRSSGLTEAGELKGKLAYIAPEVIRGRPVDRRADIFSLGALLYLITTGRHPFKGDHPGETLRNISDAKPPLPPSSLRPDFPQELEAVVLKALHKNPDERWSTANDMRIALEAAMADSLEGQREMRIARFMSDVAGARGVQRRRQIAHAGEELDRQRNVDPSKLVGSQGSLRAVIVGANSPEGTQRFSTVEQHSPDSTTPTLAAPAGSFRRRLAVAGSLGGAAIACWLVVSTLDVGEATTGASLSPPVTAASSTPVFHSVSHPSALSNTTPRTNPAASSNATKEGPNSDEASEEGDEAKPFDTSAKGKATKEAKLADAVKKRAPRRATPKHTQTLHPIARPAAPEPAPAPIEAPAAKTSKTPAMNAWDPGTYGGRL